MDRRRESPWPTSPAADALISPPMRCLAAGGLLGAATATFLVHDVTLVPATAIVLGPFGLVIGLLCGAVLSPVMYLAGRHESWVLSIGAPAIAAVAVLLFFTSGVVMPAPMVVIIVCCAFLGPWAAGLLRIRARTR